MRRQRRLGFDPSPSHGAPVHGFLHGAEEHDVHQLAIIEALQKDGNEQRPILFAFEGKGQHTGKHVNEQEADEEKDGAHQVAGRGVNCRQPGKLQFFQGPEPDGPEKQQIDERRDERKRKLKHKDVGQRDPAERAVLPAEERAAMLPKRLQRAERPAETLADELSRRPR